MIKTVFFGTPGFAKEFLAAMHADEDFSVEAVVCQPDKPVGRKKVLTAPETKVFVQELETSATTPNPSFEKEGDRIKVYQPENLRTSNLGEDLKKLDADIFVVIAYGKIIPQNILDIPKLGTINVHPSLLPKYRGPSPIQSVILNQESETAITIMLIDDKMDHGPILTQTSIELDPGETSISLRSKVTELGAPLLIETIKKYVADKIKPQEQNHDKATFCKMLTKSDGQINWQRSAEAIDAQHRALIEWPGVYTTWARDDRPTIIKLHKLKIADREIEPGKVEIEGKQMFIGTKTKALEIIKLQPENSSIMSAEAFVQGHREIHQTILK